MVSIINKIFHETPMIGNHTKSMKIIHAVLFSQKSSDNQKLKKIFIDETPMIGNHTKSMKIIMGVPCDF